MIREIEASIGEYRGRCRAADLVSFQVALKESNLAISSGRRLYEEALTALSNHRKGLEAYIQEFPEFLRSLVPIPAHPRAPRVVARMSRAAYIAGVGPMAAVAGALADEVGRALSKHSSEVIVENGGDIYCRVARPRTVAIAGGESPLSYAVGVTILPAMGEVGVCTSSGTCGGSLSFGKADAACVIAKTAALADAAATAVGNLVQSEATIQLGLAAARRIPGVYGAVVIVGERLGAWGDVQLVEL